MTKTKVVAWRARPTVYRGIQMRSRLEAAWAEQLDAMGEQWEYEPRCFASEEGQYLPDFVFTYTSEPETVRIYVECKPIIAWAGPDTTPSSNRMLRILRASDPTARLWIVHAADENGLVVVIEILPDGDFGFVDLSTYFQPVASLHAKSFYA